MGPNNVPYRPGCESLAETIDKELKNNPYMNTISDKY